MFPFEGYNKVKDETGLICIRRIRGDNYCALRAVIFKILSSGIDILSEFKDNHKLCQVGEDIFSFYAKQSFKKSFGSMHY